MDLRSRVAQLLTGCIVIPCGAAGIVGCDGQVSVGAKPKLIDSVELEHSLEQRFAQPAGLKPEELDITCPGDVEAVEGKRFECSLDSPFAEDFVVNVTLTDDNGEFEAEVPTRRPTEPNSPAP